MRIIAADDEPYALMNLADAIMKAKPDAELKTFDNTDDVIAYAKENPIDVAFLDVEFYGGGNGNRGSKAA